MIWKVLSSSDGRGAVGEPERIQFYHYYYPFLSFLYFCAIHTRFYYPHYRTVMFYFDSSFYTYFLRSPLGFVVAGGYRVFDLTKSLVICVIQNPFELLNLVNATWSLLLTWLCDFWRWRRVSKEVLKDFLEECIHYS